MSNGMRKNLEIKVNMDDKIITNNFKIPKDITAKTINQNNMTQIPESHLFTSKHADLKRHAGKIFFYI